MKAETFASLTKWERERIIAACHWRSMNIKDECLVPFLNEEQMKKVIHWLYIDQQHNPQDVALAKKLIR